MTIDTRSLRALPFVLVNTGDPRIEGRKETVFAALTDDEFAAYQRGGVNLDNARIVHTVLGRVPTDADRQTAAEKFERMGKR